MNKPFFRVHKAGALTTVQDLGRHGYQQYGISSSGALDSYAMQIANILVGNNPDEAVLECTLTGPQLEMLQDCIIAVCGADFSPTLNDKPLQMWKSHFLKKGDILTLTSAKSGVRAYISLAGGFSGAISLGSRSTFLRGQLGGFEGRQLKKEDLLCSEAHHYHRLTTKRQLAPALIPHYSKQVTVRVIRGPHDVAFHDDALAAFFSHPYKVTTESDRMGYRLSGPSLKHKPTTPADIVSTAVPNGGIQVPASGQPIILLNDRQTTGGYTLIGTVISVDLPKIAQAAPGASIFFKEVSIESAQQKYLKLQALLRKLQLAHT